MAPDHLLLDQLFTAMTAECSRGQEGWTFEQYHTLNLKVAI
jgi:hypothetical protein